MQSEISKHLAPHGLSCLASAPLHAGERPGFRSVHLIGTVGAGLWPAFSSSKEFVDGLPDPLDRWSKRNLGEAGRALGMLAAFPSDGPPFLPVITWAKRSGRYHSSPLGLAIHSELGLWTSFRGLLFSADGINAPSAAPSPCDSCADRPCLTSCPVDAFTARGYDVACCSAAVIAGRVDCQTGGCRARLACPVAAQTPDRVRYHRDQIAFHMDRFVDSRRAVTLE